MEVLELAEETITADRQLTGSSTKYPVPLVEILAQLLKVSVLKRVSSSPPYQYLPL